MHGRIVLIVFIAMASAACAPRIQQAGGGQYEPHPQYVEYRNWEPASAWEKLLAAGGGEMELRLINLRRDTPNPPKPDYSWPLRYKLTVNVSEKKIIVTPLGGNDASRQVDWPIYKKSGTSLEFAIVPSYEHIERHMIGLGLFVPAVGYTIEYSMNDEIAGAHFKGETSWGYFRWPNVDSSYPTRTDYWYQFLIAEPNPASFYFYPHSITPRVFKNLNLTVERKGPRVPVAPMIKLALVSRALTTEAAEGPDQLFRHGFAVTLDFSDSRIYLFDSGKPLKDSITREIRYIPGKQAHFFGDSPNHDERDQPYTAEHIWEWSMKPGDLFTEVDPGGFRNIFRFK